MCYIYRTNNSFGIVTVNFNNIPAPGPVFSGNIFRINSVYICRKLHTVAVIKHYQVRQAQMPGYTAGTLRNFLLYTAVRNKRICFMRHYIAKTSLQKTFGNSTPHGHSMSLAKGARRIFHTTLNIQLRMAGSHATPLTKLLQFFNCIVPCQCQNRENHWRHVSRVKEETVTGKPCRIFRVSYQELRIKHINKISTAHCSAGVT